MSLPRFLSAHALELRARPAEIVNTITHGAGFLLSIPACAALAYLAWSVDAPYQVAAIGLYAFGFIGTYAASTASHSLHAGSINRWLRMLDQGFIYRDRVARLLEPFANGRFGHRFTKRGHADICHDDSFRLNAIYLCV